MRYIVIILWIACLGACNPDVKQKVTVNGKLTNYKGNKIYFEISGRDSLVKAELDSAGRFSACLELDEGTYVRLMNGKAAFPLYLAPGMKLRVEMDGQSQPASATLGNIFEETFSGGMKIEFFLGPGIDFLSNLGNFPLRNGADVRSFGDILPD